jgi:hypothetical protein
MWWGRGGQTCTNTAAVERHGFYIIILTDLEYGRVCRGNQGASAPRFLQAFQPTDSSSWLWSQGFFFTTRGI